MEGGEGGGEVARAADAQEAEDDLGGDLEDEALEGGIGAQLNVSDCGPFCGDSEDAEAEEEWKVEGGPVNFGFGNMDIIMLLGVGFYVGCYVGV